MTHYKYRIFTFKRNYVCEHVGESFLSDPGTLITILTNCIFRFNLYCKFYSLIKDINSICAWDLHIEYVSGEQL